MTASDHLSPAQFSIEPSQRWDLRKYSAMRGDEKLGHIQIALGPVQPTVSDVYVEPEHQRQGVATALWEHAKQQHPDLRHSMYLSRDGEAWVRSL